jgi:autotransporter translocation and assembly factor TamB
MEIGADTEDSAVRPGRAGDPRTPPPEPPPEPPGPPRSFRRRWRWPLRFSALLLALLVGAFIYVRHQFNGVRLARFVTDEILNKQFLGRTQVESIDWPITAIFDLRHVRATVREVHVYDPHNKLVLWLPSVTAEVDAWELIKPKWLGGKGDIVVHRLDVPRGFCDVTQQLDYSSIYGVETGFIAAFTPRLPLPKGKAFHTRPAGFVGPIIDLHNATLHHIDLNLDMLGWHARANDIDTTAWLWLSQRDPAHPQFLFALPVDPDAPARIGAAEITIDGVDTFQVHDASLHEFGQLPRAPAEMVWKLDAITDDGARVATHGSLGLEPPGHENVDFDLTASHIDGLVRRYSDGLGGGDDAHVTLGIHGQAADSTLSVRVEHVDLDAHAIAPGAPPARLEVAALSWRMGREDADLTELHLDLLGGSVRGAGNLDISMGLPTFVLDLKLDPALDLSPWLPRQALQLAGRGTLSGKVRVYGSVKDVWANPIDLQLGRAHAQGAINWTQKTGEILPVGLRVDVPETGASLRASGSVNVIKRTLALGFHASVERLAPWLQRLHAPALASAASATGLISGSFDAPRVSAQVSADGVPWTGRAEARLDYSPGQLTLKELRAAPLGGTLVAGAKLRLGGKQAYIDEAWASVANLALAKIPGLGKILGGTGSIELTVLGTVEQPQVAVAAVASDLTVSGEPLGKLEAELRTDEDGLTIDRFQLATADASLLASGTVGYQGDLDLSLDVARLPLASLPGLADERGLGVDGTASLKLRIGGTTRAATASGMLGLAGVAFGQTMFGAGSVNVASPAPGTVHFGGKLFQGKFVVDGEATLIPPYKVSARVDFKRVEIDEFTSVAAALGVHGWLSGHVEVALADKLRLSLRITELHASVDGYDERGRPTPVPVEAVGEIAVEYDGVTARLLEPARLKTPEGEFSLEGSAGAKALDVSLHGQVQLALLEAYTRRYVDKVQGVARADLRVTGTPAAPQVHGTLALTDVHVAPRGVETEVVVPLGTLTVSNSSIDVDGLAIEVDGHRLDVNGSLTLVGLKPKKIDAHLSGRIAAELLAIVAGEQVADTSGSAPISVSVTGDLANPNIEGTLSFDSPFNVSPRSLRREINLGEGRIVFKNHMLTVEGVRGSIDDGTISVDGTLRLADWKFAGIEVQAKLSAFKHRIPGVLELEANLDVHLYSIGNQLHLTGQAEIIDGRYLQEFRITKLLVPVRTSERSVPFWVGVPMLEKMSLKLNVTTTGNFAVATNFANLQISGNVTLLGTPADPRLTGQVRVEEGTLHFPAIRPTFDVEGGTVLFSPMQQAAEGTSVDVSGRSLYVDRDERQHNVRMHIYGRLNRLIFDLSTEEGLNAAQTLVLISAGRTSDEVRQQARGESGQVVPRDTSNSNTGGGVSSDSSSVAGTADRLVKDFASDFLAVMIEEPLKNKTGLDCMRLEIGTESSLLYTCKKFGRLGRVEAEGEYGYQGRSRVKAGFSTKMTNRLSLSYIIERRPLQTFDEENTTQQSFELKYRWTVK